MMDKEMRDAVLRTGIRALQSDIDKHCIAVLGGPDFFTLLCGDTEEQLWERLVEACPSFDGIAELFHNRADELGWGDEDDDV